MALSVIKAGLLDTIQDMGRNHYGSWGINPGGSMDPYASQVANMLVGNCNTEAVLEIHFPGPQILFEQNAMIAITGADFSPMLNDEPVPLWQPIVMRKNTVLHFPKLKWGARCYLSIHGGFCIDQWLNSYSTNLKAGAGGLGGRQLKKGDSLSPRESVIYFAGLLRKDKNSRILPWRADTHKTYRFLNEIFVIKGNEWDQLNQSAQDSFLKNNFIIHPSSDRMGYQLKGVEVSMEHKFDLISSAVNFGTLQALPNGQLIILMADHQTTGGYPRLAHVISSHLPKLAQLRTSECMQFTITDLQHAEELLGEQQKELQILQRACKDHLNELVCRALT
jgi:antagonist of KipI